MAGLFLILWTTRFAARLALDHSAVLYPDVDSPFSDAIDVVNRLLPYHVYKQPKEDLELLMSFHKGKGKASEDNLRHEISGVYISQTIHGLLLMGSQRQSSQLNVSNGERLSRRDSAKSEFGQQR